MAPGYSSSGLPGGYHQYALPHRLRQYDSGSTSLLEDCSSLAAHTSRWLLRTWGRWMAFSLRSFWARRARNLTRDLAPRRLLSFPHLLALLWLVLLLWGERWVFGTRVSKCQWEKWEDWPAGATPHHAVLVADPQLIDPHTYPGRPWPLSSLTVLITDNYLRRSYNRLLDTLTPDTVLFLGDLFDGGREWSDAKDPAWSHRPAWEQKFSKIWQKKYGNDFWLDEYARFGDLFLEPWVGRAGKSRPNQRGRKLIASLPGNHDLGFGSEVKLSVRERFETYFGEPNRVDVIGNHTFVSLDTVSLSADTSEEEAKADLRNIYKPTEHFLDELPYLKRKAVARELRYQRGEGEELQHPSRIEELPTADFSDRPSMDPGEAADLELPTVLLSHVPLFRPSGMPCGPLREHWPPSKPTGDSMTPVNPDPRNALSLSRGYQYQNVLNQQDTLKIVDKLGERIAHAFSGDDHDYCEIKHDAQQGGMTEITVKSISMAMGVPTPGFLLVSMWNPIDEQGKSILPADTKTMQTHLCLLPNQIATYTKYVLAIILSLILLAMRALLVPVLGLSSFALDAHAHDANGFILGSGGAGGNNNTNNNNNNNISSSSTSGGYLFPGGYSSHNYKAKREDPEDDDKALNAPTAGYSASSRIRSSSLSSSSKRARSPSLAAAARAAGTPVRTGSGKSRRHSKAAGNGGGNGWGWGSTSAAAGGGGGGRGPPKIQIGGDDEDAYYAAGGKWRPAAPGRSRPRSTVGLVVREVLVTAWRVAWIVVVFLVYLTWKG